MSELSVKSSLTNVPEPVVGGAASMKTNRSSLDITALAAAALLSPGKFVTAELTHRVVPFCRSYKYTSLALERFGATRFVPVAVKRTNLPSADSDESTTSAFKLLPLYP